MWRTYPIAASLLVRVRANLQDALDVAEALGLRGGDVDLLDELGFLLAGGLDLELLGLLAQFGDLHGSELLTRKRGLGGGGVTLLVALFAIALAVATVVVALVLALVALLVALVLATVGASVVIGLSGRGAIGCGGVGIGRSATSNSETPSKTATFATVFPISITRFTE